VEIFIVAGGGFGLECLTIQSAIAPREKVPRSFCLPPGGCSMQYRPYGGPVPNAGSHGDAGAAIREAVQDFCTNFNTGNYDHCAALYTPDAYFLAPNQEAIQGNRGIERALRRLADQGYQDLRLETIRVDTSGDMAIEVGRYSVAIRQANGTTVLDRGKYLSAWRRFGAWLKVAICWSSDLAQPHSQQEDLPNSHEVGIITPDVPRSA
jgi:uncharacterized protein (TIGR02246 family)